MASLRSRSKQLLRVKHEAKKLNAGKQTGSQALKKMKATSKVKKFKGNKPIRLGELG